MRVSVHRNGVIGFHEVIYDRMTLGLVDHLKALVEADRLRKALTLVCRLYRHVGYFRKITIRGSYRNVTGLELVGGANVKAEPMEFALDGTPDALEREPDLFVRGVLDRVWQAGELPRCEALYET